MQILFYILLGFSIALFLLVVSSWNSRFRGRTKIHVNAPVQEAFRIFMDEQYMKEWLSNKQMELVGVDNISGEKGEVGSQWKLTYLERGNRTLEMVETVTDHVENEHFGFDLEDKFAEFHIDVYFKPENDGTTIVEETDGRGKSLIARTLLRMFGGQARKMKNAMYQNLKAVIERESQANNG